MVAAHENHVGLQRRIWVEFPSLLEEFRQALPILELQSNPPVFELKLLYKTSRRVAYPRSGRL